MSLSTSLTDSTSAADELVVTVVHTIDQLREVADAYQALLDRLPDGRGVFYAIEWLEAFAPLFLTEGRRLHFLLIWRGAELVGVAPMVVSRRPWSRGHARVLEFWGGIDGSLRLEGDLLFPRASDAEAGAQAVVRWLTSAASNVDVMNLQYFREVSTSRAAFVAAARPDAIRLEPMRTHRAQMAASYPEHLARLKKSMLSIVQNRQRAIERDLGAELVCRERLSDDELAQVEQLHIKRQQQLMAGGRERHSLFENDMERQCYRQVLEAAATDGTGRHYLLKAGTQIIAFGLCFHKQRTLFCHVTAFDPDLGRYKLGRVLELMKTRAEIERGDTDVMDMLPGTTQVKEDFGTEVFNHFRYQGYCRRTLGSRVRQWVWVATGKAGRAVKRVMGRGARAIVESTASAPLR
jgi:CelD/BcsL family acetyltransferase involved in cellulose biosynthesis